MQPPFNFKLYLKFNSYLRFDTVWFNFTDLFVCFSSTSIKPKSSGYNYGTDISLEKNYELAVMDNLNRFLSFLENENINECK